VSTSILGDARFAGGGGEGIRKKAIRERRLFYDL